MIIEVDLLYLIAGIASVFLAAVSYTLFYYSVTKIFLAQDL